MLITTLIHINQCNTDKQWTNASELEHKIPSNSSIMTTDVLNAKISEVTNIILDNFKYVTTQEFDKLSAEILFSR